MGECVLPGPAVKASERSTRALAQRVLKKPNGGETECVARVGKDVPGRRRWPPLSTTALAWDPLGLQRLAILPLPHTLPQGFGAGTQGQADSGLSIRPKPTPGSPDLAQHPQQMLDKGPRTIAGSTAPLQLGKSPRIPVSVSTSVKGTEPDLKGPHPERRGKETEEPATLPSPCRPAGPDTQSGPEPGGPGLRLWARIRTRTRCPRHSCAPSARSTAVTWH